MLVLLAHAHAQARSLPIQRRLNHRTRHVQAAERLMVATVQRLIQERRVSSTVGTMGDLLDRRLTGVDRQSGERLDDDNSIAQCITFLIAGQETTSGLLSFALYALLKRSRIP